MSVYILSCMACVGNLIVLAVAIVFVVVVVISQLILIVFVVLISGHALHEQNLQKQVGFGTLVNSQEHRTCFSSR